MGITKSPLVRATQAMAVQPIGADHFPSVKGPGTNLARPPTLRSKVGMTYDMYKAIVVTEVKAKKAVVEPIAMHPTTNSMDLSFTSD